MKKQELTTPQERKLKFVEAGILFVLILAITVFVGARLAGRDDGAEAVAEATTSGAIATQTVAAIPAVAGSEATGEEPIHPAEIATESGDAVQAAEVAAPPRVITYALAEETYLAGRYAEAADMFAVYTDEHQDNAWGYYMLGLSEWKAGDPEAAAGSFQAALALKPDHVKSLVNLGRVLLDLDRVADAQSAVTMALSADESSLEGRRVMGRIQHNLGQHEAAAESYLTVLAEREDDVWSLNNLGLIRIEQERFGEALPPLAKAAQLRSDVAVIQNNLGVALERSGYFAAAARAYEAALESDGDHAKAEISLARVEGLATESGAEEIDLIAIAASFDARPAIATGETAATDSMLVPVPDEFATPNPELEVAASLPGTEAEAGGDDPDSP